MSPIKQHRPHHALHPLLARQLGSDRIDLVLVADLVLDDVFGLLPLDEARQVELALHLDRAVALDQLLLLNDLEVFVLA